MNRIIEKFSAFFVKDSTMDMAFFGTILIFTVNMTVKALIPMYSLLVCDSVFYLCLVFLYVSFKKHNKNVQKGLLGATLMWYLYDELNYLLGGIIFNSYSFEAYDNPAGKGYLVLNLICTVLFAGLFINHFIINSDHHSSPINILINQILVVLFSVCSIVSAPFQVYVLSGNTLEIIEGITWQLGVSTLVLLIASYESKLDAYRLDREAAGWTEEAGYPKGYVHQKDRKQ